MKCHKRDGLRQKQKLATATTNGRFGAANRPYAAMARDAKADMAFVLPKNEGCILIHQEILIRIFLDNDFNLRFRGSTTLTAVKDDK